MQCLPSVGKTRSRVVLIVVALASVLGSSLTAGVASAGDEPCVRVAFVYDNETKTPGFQRGQKVGENYMRKKLPCAEVKAVESIPEGPGALPTFELLVDEGYELIFANSFGYGDQLLEVAADNPDVKFEHAVGFRTADNLSTFYGARSEGWYLQGIAAADASESGQLGVIAPFPIPSIISDINGFTLGARSVNPDATVQVVFTNAFEDAIKDKQAAEALLDEGIDYLAQMSGSPSVGSVAEENDIPWNGADDPKVKSFGPSTYVGAPYLKWGRYFLQEAQAVIDGTWESQSYLGTIADRFVAFHIGNIPKDVVADIKAKKAEIADGTFVVFAGPIAAQDGSVLVPEGQVAAFEDITTSFVEGVIGEIPQQG
jgi:basic membrane protein A and related proteins